MIAYHFLPANAEPVFQRAGLHAPIDIMDALRCARGPVLCRAVIGGTKRRILWVYDATDVLHEFACRCAEDALALVASPDSRSRAAIAAKRAWLRGEINADELADARGGAECASRDPGWYAAKDAAGSAAGFDAWTAAKDAARSAASHAGWDAARDTPIGAAWRAARYVARDAAFDAARLDASVEQVRRIRSMIAYARRQG